MKYKYGVYCSGNASRLLKFYECNSLKEFPLELIYYDGMKTDIQNTLESIFDHEILEYYVNTEESKEHKRSKKEIVSNSLSILMEKREINYLFCFGNQILSCELINKFENRIINFHPSILPSFPGLNSIDQALNANVKVIGNTAHFIDKGVDTGLIIMQSIMSIDFYRCYEDVLGMQIPMLRTIWQLLDGDKILVEDDKVIILQEPNSDKFYSISFF